MANGRFSRREILASGAGALGAAALAGRSGAARGAVAHLPNIVFLLADDLGVADLSVYGRRDYRTPVLDRLAREGMLFANGYANSAVCSATRTALITGRYQGRLRVGLYEPGGGGADYGLPADHPTLPSLLRKLGYRTSLFGKWHLGHNAEHGPNRSGYDYFFGFRGGYDDYFRVGGAQQLGVPIPGAPPPADLHLYENEKVADEPGYLTYLLADHASEEIRRNAAARQPFFLSLHFNAPHWPWEGPGDEAASKSIVSAFNLDGGSIGKYGEMVTALDSAVGRVLDTIRRAGIERDTLVVFTSDNGGERFSDTWPYTGAKGELLEGGLRVPLIIRWPARIKPGSQTSQLMISMDFLPTLLAAAGGAPDPAYPSDGENLLPVILGEAPPHPRRLFWRYKASEQAAVRDGDYKYLRINGQEYLFNVVADQRERANLKDKEPARYAALKAAHAAWNATLLPYTPDITSANSKGQWADRY